MTRHILMPQSDGGHVCERCGAVFDPYARLADIMQRPCKKGVQATVSYPREELDRLFPHLAIKETDDKGAALIDRWLKERDDE
jgi:hypothetical protein